MERAKAERKITRRRFTICVRKIEELITAGKVVEINIEFKKLSSIYNDLTIAQNKVLNLWLDDADRDETLFENDVDAADEYISQWYTIEQKVKDCIEPNNHIDSDSRHTCTIKNFNHEEGSITNNRRHYRLPKLDLPTFNGDIKRWLAFWTQFKKIDSDDSIDKDDKFLYLLQCMEHGSPARELIESFPPSGENYDNALEQLKQRFAKKGFLTEHYVRQLLLVVLAQAKGGQKISLRELYDKITTQILALESMDVNQDTYSSFLHPLVESALPEDLLKAWHRCRSPPEKSSDMLSRLLDFVKQEVETDERIRLAHTGFATNFTAPEIPSTSCFTTSDKQIAKHNNTKERTENNSKVCLFCDKTNHASSECVVAVNKTWEERVEVIKQKKACGICLNTGHSFKKCWKRPKCVICGKKHFPIMCNSTKRSTIEEIANKGEQISVTQSASSSNNKTVLLQTLKVKVVSETGVQVVRVLLDSGAQRSFIKTDVVNKLNLKPIGHQELSHHLFGGTVTKSRVHNLYNVNVHSLDNKYSCNIDVLGQNIICKYLPKLRSGEVMSQLNSLGIFVTDCTDDISEISVLIGSDILGSLYTGRVVRVDDNLLAVETKLGWTIQGPTVGVHCAINNIHTLHCSFNEEDFWKLETIGIQDETETKSQKMLEADTMKYFEETIRINEENRYEVRLPWKETSKALLPNYDLALKRLASTTARLNKLGILKDYDLVFEEWVKDGIIEEVAIDDSNTGHYLPHHAVVKDSSITTKIRPVFDASCKDFNKLSINMCLEKGVNLIELIPKLLINFRRNAVGITADIKKAFLQISLWPEDRNYLKFLWWRDISRKDYTLKVYRHQRVVFGVTTSPFLLSATILHHLKKYNSTTAAMLRTSFYVDNCIVSVKDEKEMNNFISEAKQIMMDGQFELRCWVTGPIITDKDTNIIPILGVRWDPHRDELFCNLPSIPKFIKNGFTKRSVLALTQSIFDPVGFVSPITVIPKIVIQKCWIMNVDWDQNLPPELTKVMEDWTRQINKLESYRIPRRLSHADLDQSDNSLHIFCDASQAAYACCIYLRSEYCNIVTVQLVLARSRVAPSKRITMPRLELIATLMGTRLMAEVREGLDIQCKEFYWTDSSIVLAWLKRKNDLNVFVYNRVTEILRRSKLEDWRHVPGIMNPADLPSRGCNVDKILENKWWMGPQWLNKSPKEWPTYSEEPDNAEVLKEVKKSCIVVNNVNICLFSERLTYFSKYNKIVCMIGWCLRFVNNCRNRVKNNLDGISANEYSRAEKCLLRILQQEDNQEITSKAQTFQDSEGFIRIKTRLTASNEMADFKCPIVLSAKNIIVERLVAQKHIELLHAGSQTMISSLREHFWIINIRRLAKKIVNKCVICKRFNSKPCTVPTAPLPLDRIHSESVFEVTGVDLAGPLTLKDKKKCWIILFTCATYRAIHLELTTSLSTEDLMFSLRRFLARRGKVRIIYSDNGTNLRGASNVLNSAWLDVAQTMSIQKIEWRFIPPSAPWWGGFWERMVRTLKEIMRRILGKASVYENELHTILCETEAVVNSRPLTYITDNTENLRPLTPNMFLNIGSVVGNEVDMMDHIDGGVLTSRWRYLNGLNTQLKQRFRVEYLSLLTQHTKDKPQRCLKVGDIVLVGSDNTKRINWPLGLVLDLFPGPDGHERVARVKTSTGDRIRALQRLYRLEVSSVDPLVDKRCGAINTKPQPNANCEDKTNTRSGRVIKVPQRLNL